MYTPFHLTSKLSLRGSRKVSNSISSMALKTSGAVRVFLLLFWATVLAQLVAYRTNTLSDEMR